MNSSTAMLIFKLLDLAVFAFGRAGPAMERYRAGRERVRQIVQEGRAPTPEEVAEVDGLIDAELDRLNRPIS